MYLAAPQLAIFGGLSGIVTAALTALLLELRSEGGVRGRLALAGLLLVAAKLAGELCSGSSWLVATGNEPFVPAPASHLAGAAVAVLVYVVAATRSVVHYWRAAASPASSRTSSSAPGASPKPSVSAVSAAAQ